MKLVFIRLASMSQQAWTCGGSTFTVAQYTTPIRTIQSLPSSSLSTLWLSLFKAPHPPKILGAQLQPTATNQHRAEMTYVNHGSITAVGILFPTLAVLCVSVRIWVWRKYASGTFVDDILIIPAAVYARIDLETVSTSLTSSTDLCNRGRHSLSRWYVSWYYMRADRKTKSTIVQERNRVTLAVIHQHSRQRMYFRKWECIKSRWSRYVIIVGVFLWSIHWCTASQLEYGFWPVNNFSIGFTKLSILFLYRRIFQGRTRRTAFDVINWFLIILTICWTLAFSLTELFACGAHANYAWGTLYELRYDCVNTFQVFAVSSSINFIVDLAILIEPIAVVCPHNRWMTEMIY